MYKRQFETLAREYETSAESSAAQRKLQERTRQLAAEILKKNYTLRRGMQPHRNKYDDIPDLHVPLSLIHIFIIRGALFDRVQQRDYCQYTTYLGRFRPDSVRAERAFQRFVKYPYAQDCLLYTSYDLLPYGSELRQCPYRAVRRCGTLYLVVAYLAYELRSLAAHCTGNQQENEVKAGAFYIVDQSREQMVILTYCAIY